MAIAMKNYRPRSRDAFARACRVIPGGVNSPARAFGAVGGQPVFIARGEGPYVYDIDGNQYLDFVGSWGPLILGHAHPGVVRAVEEALHRGASFGAPTEAETRLAEIVVDAMPSLEMVRMVSSGTEAAMSALRLARAFTGRNRIVKFAGCYHGHVDSLLVQAGSAATTLGVPNSPGVTPANTAGTIVLPYNDVLAAEQAFALHGDEIAAVIVEPIAGNMGVVVPDMEFLERLRDLTQNHDAVLIYDEVITGFRVSFGGAQQLFHQMPDLTILGKVLGGGLPAAAYGGSADIMSQVMPAGPVFQAGTLSGNPLAMAAGIATLEELRDRPRYRRLDEMGAQLTDGLSRAAAETQTPCQIARQGSMLTLFFSAKLVQNYEDAKTSDTERYARFFRGMLNRGVYLPCSQFEAWFISAAMTPVLIGGAIAAARETFRELAAG
jgi:glutamate-1-semialdehyde 2,1-aminomutase